MILCIQFILVSLSFPLAELWTEKPLFYSDAPLHWYRMKLSINNHDIGYDPFFSAGTVGGLSTAPATKFPAILAILLNPWFSEIVIWKGYSFICAVLGPLCVSLALRCLGLGARSLFVGSLLGIILWWASVFRWYHTAGMVSFVFVSFLALPYFVMIVRFLQGSKDSNGWSSAVSLGLAGALSMFIHPLFPIPIMFGTFFYLAMNWHYVAWQRTLIFLLCVSLLSLLPNVYWIRFIFLNPLFEDPNIVPHQQLVDISIVWRELIGLWEGNAQGSKLYGLLVFMTMWACIRNSETRNNSIIYTLALLGVFLIIFAAVGASIAAVGHTVQPNRFAPVGYLFLVIPATYGSLAILRVTFEAQGFWLRLVSRLSLLIAILVGTYAINEVRREVSYADIGHHGIRPPEVRGVGDYSRRVLDWLANSTTNSGRILFETSKGRIYDGGRMTPYYAYKADREFIGGPQPFDYFSGFWDGWLYNRPIAEISREEFMQYAKLYNIGWIIVHSCESKRYLEKISEIILVDKFKELQFYRIEQPLDYFIKGGGNVQERYHNKILLTNITSKEIIIKFHYIDGIISEPSATIVPIQFMDDPNPFIKILDPPKQLLFYMP